MISTPSSFSYELLSNMKFKELQKLSAQFRVNKRWAKKQELIENLLRLKDKVRTPIDDNQEENEWRNGSAVFFDFKENKENEVDRRLTFNVDTKSSSEETDRHGTIILSQNGNNLLDETFNSRETYNVSQSGRDFGIEPMMEARATFEIPQKKELLKEIDPRATFDIPQNGNSLLQETENGPRKNSNKNIKKSKNEPQVNVKTVGFDYKKNLDKVQFEKNKQNAEEESGKETKSQVKMLTIPYARITRRNEKEISKSENSAIKMSKKSINIKKSTRLPVSKNNLTKSPALSSIKKSVQRQTIQSLVKPQPGNITQSRVPVRLQFNEEKQKAEKRDESNKENIKRTSIRRVSKGADDALKKNTKTVKGSFKTQLSSAARTPFRTDLAGQLNASVTPGCKSAIKPNTATKMPDFTKIHTRHFEQMDSLPEYLKKKEERARKLFGIPQPGQQLQSLSKSAPVFRFQSVVAEKGIKGNAVRSLAAQFKQKQADSKTPQKETFKSRLPPSKLRTEIKEENRSRIHGVRTNKRFELQMKLRNL